LRIAEVHGVSAERTVLDVLFSETIKTSQARIVVVGAYNYGPSVFGVEAHVTDLAHYAFISFKKNEANRLRSG